MVDLLQHVAGVIGQRHLMLTLKCLTAGVSLVIAGAIARILNQGNKAFFGREYLLFDALDFEIEFCADPA